jgi:hypothetical protein
MKYFTGIDGCFPCNACDPIKGGTSLWDAVLQATSPKNARLEKRGHGSVRQKKKTKIQAKKAAFRESA